MATRHAWRRVARHGGVLTTTLVSMGSAILGLFGSSILALWGWAAGRTVATAGAADGVVVGGGNWVCLVHRFGEFGCVGFFGGEAAVGAGKAADLKTEIRATGLRKPWACKLFI